MAARAWFAGMLAMGLLLAAPAPAAVPAQLLPVDTAATRPDFFSFRAQLQSAIARRDVAAVLAVVDKDVRNGFGGDDGIDAFRRTWQPERADSSLWDVLGTLLALGGDFDGEGFAAPYVSSHWPEDVDAFEFIAVVGAQVRVRAAPDRTAQTLATVDFALLARVGADDADANWIAVQLADGRRGYIDARFVRSAVDHRARFEKTAAGWRLVSLLAGD